MLGKHNGMYIYLHIHCSMEDTKITNVYVPTAQWTKNTRFALYTFFCCITMKMLVCFRIIHSYGDVTIIVKELQISSQNSVFMAIEQWGLFSIPHLLRHGAYVHNGCLRGHVTPTPIAKRLEVELSLPVFATWVYRDRASNPNLPHSRRTP